jgi:hypothetical protein
VSTSPQANFVTDFDSVIVKVALDEMYTSETRVYIIKDFNVCSWLSHYQTATLTQLF